VDDRRKRAGVPPPPLGFGRQRKTVGKKDRCPGEGKRIREPNQQLILRRRRKDARPPFIRKANEKFLYNPLPGPRRRPFAWAEETRGPLCTFLISSPKRGKKRRWQDLPSYCGPPPGEKRKKKRPTPTFPILPFIEKEGKGEKKKHWEKKKKGLRPTRPQERTVERKKEKKGKINSRKARQPRGPAKKKKEKTPVRGDRKERGKGEGEGKKWVPVGSWPREGEREKTPLLHSLLSEEKKKREGKEGSRGCRLRCLLSRGPGKKKGDPFHQIDARERSKGKKERGGGGRDFFWFFFFPP